MSALKGFQSLLKGIETRFGSNLYRLPNLYNTLSQVAHDKMGLDTSPKWAGLISSGNLVDALPWADNSYNRKRVLQITGHSLVPGRILRFTTGVNQFREIQVLEVLDANTVLLAGELPSDSPGGETFSILQPLTPTTDTNGNLSIVEGQTSVVDFLDVGTYVPAASGDGIIPRSSNNAVQVVASLAAPITKIQSVSDVGEFINLYTDAARTQLIAHMVLTPDEIVDVSLPAGASIYLGAARDVDIDDASSVIQLNFIG